MTERTYEIIELAGSSKTSIEDAIQNAVKAAHKLDKNYTWFEVVETRGHIQKGKVAYYQVIIKLGHALA